MFGKCIRSVPYFSPKAITMATGNCWFSALSDTTQLIGNLSYFISFTTAGRNYPVAESVTRNRIAMPHNFQKMNQLDLTDSELFENLLEFEFQNKYIDLHNDFKLVKLIFKTNEDLILYFKSDEDRKLQVYFKDVEIFEFSFDVNDGNITIDNFHRGRYDDNGSLKDEIHLKKCFYMEFLEDSKISVLASRVYLLM